MSQIQPTYLDPVAPRRRTSVGLLIPLWIVGVPVGLVVFAFFLAVAAATLPAFEVASAMFFHALLLG